MESIDIGVGQRSECMVSIKFEVGQRSDPCP
jgi:hypothetical protein